MAIRRATFPLPDIDDDRVAPYFEASSRSELAISRCSACRRWVWYPEARCPACGGDLGWEPTSGRGELFTWAIVRRAFLPAFENRVPFVTAIVALDDDPAVRVVAELRGVELREGELIDAAGNLVREGTRLRAEHRPLRFATVPDAEVVVPSFVPDLSSARSP